MASSKKHDRIGGLQHSCLVRNKHGWMRRKHSSRMRTARYHTIRASPPDANTGMGQGPQVNKFEQVSSLGHQMSLSRDSCMVGRGVALYRRTPSHSHCEQDN